VTLANRIAVLLVGELRTWPKAAKYLFNFFNDRATQVDYYFVTWDISTDTGKQISIGYEDIIHPFNQNNIKLYDYKILAPIGKQRTTFYNQAWLAKVGNLLKRRVEQRENFIYDQVIETRPDIYLRRQSNERFLWSMCKDFEYEGGRPVLGNDGYSNGFLTMPDHYWRTNSYTNDIVANRFSFKKSTEHYTVTWHVSWTFYNHHWTISNYMFTKLLKPGSYEESSSTRDYAYFCAIRPNFPEDMNLDEQHPWEILQPMFINWGQPYNHLNYGPNSSEPIVDL
jgi:hypothetical protein